MSPVIKTEAEIEAMRIAGRLDRKIRALFCGELLEPDRCRQAGWPATHDQDVEFH